MSNFFYVVYPFDVKLRKVLNTLKVVANHNQRSEAHITIRGPYNKKRLSSNDVDRWSKVISNEIIKVTTTDNFFAYNQNTVFFKCGENLTLRKIWKKFTYNEFRPHITIYDGEDTNYAYKIYDTVSEYFIPFVYEIDELSWLEPKDENRLELYKLINTIDIDFTKEILKEELIREDLNQLSKKKRLEYLKLICQYLYQKFNEITIANK